MKNLLCYIWFQVIISWMDLREGNRSYDTLKATYKGHQITISWSALISSRYLIILYATHADDTNFPQVTKYFLCQVWILKRLLTLFGDIQYIFAIHFSINVFSILIRIQSFSQNSIFEKSFDICLSYFLFFFLFAYYFLKNIFEFRRNREEYFTYRVKENRIIISKESTMKCTTIKIKINWKRIIFVKI